MIILTFIDREHFIVTINWHYFDKLAPNTPSACGGVVY
jgi:hypothetical protein